jgi:hypothetical protein
MIGEQLKLSVNADGLLSEKKKQALCEAFLRAGTPFGN